MTMEGMEETVPEQENPLKAIITEKCVDVSLSKEGKLYKEVLRQGEGEESDTSSIPGPGCEVSVHYIGSLPNGTIFDRSDTRVTPFTFKLGEGQVIRGWDEGIASMRIGERAKLYIHPEYGYGATGSGDKIPPNSPLIFEVELLSFELEDLTNSKSGQLRRQKINPGVKYHDVNEFATVKIFLKGEYEGRVFDEREVSFVLGEGSEVNIPYGVEKALYKFQSGERSVLHLGPRYAFGSTGSKLFNIPPDVSVKYTVEVLEIERFKEAWELDGPAKLAAARTAKEKGTEFFKQGKFFLAARQYKNVVNFLFTEASLEGADEEERKTLLLAGYLNQALCHLKLNEPVIARRHADDAIQFDPKNTKGYYRRGLALAAINEPEEAKKDFNKVLELEPDNKAAQQQLVQCEKLIKQFKQKEKQVYSRMFEKFAKADTAKEQAELRSQPNGLDNLDEWSKGGCDKMDVEDVVTMINPGS